MKKIVLLLYMLFLFGFSQAVNIYGIATGDNMNINFDISTSDVTVDTTSLKENVCNLGYKGYEVFGTGDTETAGYVYFHDNTKNACVGIVLSGSNWYMMGTGAMSVDTDATIYFDKIKLNYNSSDKKYYFNGNAITNTMGKINDWASVNLTGLSVLDWSKSTIDISECQNNYYANGSSCNIKLILKDQAGNPFTSLSSLDVEIQNIKSGYGGYIFMDTDANVVKNLNIDSNGVVNVLLYIIKPGDDISLSLKLSYNLLDSDGNTSTIKDINYLKAKNPLTKVNIQFKSDLIVGQDMKGKAIAEFGDRGSIDDYVLSGGFELVGDSVNKFDIKKGENISSKEFEVNIKEKALEYKQDIPEIQLKNSTQLVVSYGTLFGGNKEVSLDFVKDSVYKVYFRGVYLDGLVNNTYKQNLGATSLGRKNNLLSYGNIYNKAKKKAILLSRGKKAEDINEFKIDNLNGGIKLYNCNHNLYELGTGTYYGNNTIILKNCRLKILGNIYKGDKNSSLLIFMYSDTYKNIKDSNWISSDGSVYIKENVSDIYASILTNGSIFTITGTDTNPIISNRIYSVFNKQLYIKGLLLSKNNIGGGFAMNNGGSIYYTLPGGKKIYTNESLYGSTLSDEVQIFDLNFWRGFKFATDGSIDTNWYSEYCLHNGNSEKCKYATIIDYSQDIRKNVLLNN